MPDCGRWLRLLISSITERVYTLDQKPATGHATLLLLEEFPVLGHLPSIEQATGYAAGFGLKLWFVVQDLSQLKRHYKEGWETILGNAGVIQAFATSDLTTNDYLSKRLGECEISQITRTISTSLSASTNNQAAVNAFSSLTSPRGQAGAVLNPLSLALPSQSSGESHNTSETFNTQITKAPLATPSELEQLLARETENQLLLTKGQAPMLLERSERDS